MLAIESMPTSIRRIQGFATPCGMAVVSLSSHATLAPGFFTVTWLNTYRKECLPSSQFIPKKKTRFISE
jgi:hypothetical protein